MAMRPTRRWPGPSRLPRRQRLGGATLSTVTKRARRSEVASTHRAGVAKAMLVAGGSFAGGIGSILGAAGLWGLGASLVLSALGALCVIAALTILTAARMLR